MLDVCSKTGAPNTWDKVGKLIVETYKPNDKTWQNAYVNNPVNTLASVKAKYISVKNDGSPNININSISDLYLGSQFNNYNKYVRELNTSKSMAFVSQFNLDKVQFNNNSDIKEISIRTDCISYNVSDEIIRLIIAIMDNESDKPEDWLGIVSVILNGSENEKYTIEEWIEKACLDLRWLEGTTIDGIKYTKEERKKQIYYFSKYGVNDGKGLKHTNNYTQMEEIVKWALEGNRIFDQRIQQWVTGTDGYEQFSNNY